MEIFQNLAMGFGVAFTPINLLLCLFGCLIGTLIGVLPGIGPLATIAILLPVTFGLSPAGALIMLSGIYYGAQYGGSTTAILLRLPGESSSIVTCIDGYQMALKGRAGSALAIAAFGSLFAGCVGTILIGVFGPALAKFSEGFRSPEYFALMVFGLTAAVILANGSPVKAIGMIVFGLALGLVGTEAQSGTVRYAFGIPELFDGIDFVPLAMGLFGFAEMMNNLDNTEQAPVKTANIGGMTPNREEVRRAIPAVLRGTAVGSLLGILPGGGAVLSSFASYTLEKRITKYPHQFGAGAVEGVAGPESANNAGAQTSFIPLLTLGIPSTPIMAVMMGAMTMQGIAPGTAIITDRPELFWGIIASMWIGNLMLVIINLPLIGIWIKLLHVPYRLLFPCILVLCCVGAYCISSSTFIVFLMAGFALIGYLFSKLGCEAAPMTLGFILGPLMEEHFRRAMILADGDVTILVRRPISAVLIVAALGVVFLIVSPSFRKAREVAFRE